MTDDSLATSSKNLNRGKMRPSPSPIAPSPHPPPTKKPAPSPPPPPAPSPHHTPVTRTPVIPHASCVMRKQAGHEISCSCIGWLLPPMKLPSPNQPLTSTWPLHHQSTFVLRHRQIGNPHRHSPLTAFFFFFFGMRQEP